MMCFRVVAPGQPMQPLGRINAPANIDGSDHLRLNGARPFNEGKPASTRWAMDQDAYGRLRRSQEGFRHSVRAYQRNLHRIRHEWEDVQLRRSLEDDDDDARTQLGHPHLEEPPTPHDGPPRRRSTTQPTPGIRGMHERSEHGKIAL